MRASALSATALAPGPGRREDAGMPMSKTARDHEQAYAEVVYRPDPAEMTPAYRAAWANGLPRCMVLFERIRENATALRQVGDRAVREAREFGVPSHYGDPALGDGIIREMPDGTRQRVELRDGEEVVVETFGPRM